ncbi:protein STICHEL isoform X2 [Ipomoea triloba]|uniref:protein STICHEL isoform X2 n=1 Tax=Ipomoea triloba TaxID=35885 RepID=UPI00125D52DF|nr:protein STICHEL isoform X2 [Ipomoea triloba]
MSSEMRRRSYGGGGGGNSFDPSNLHLKRELTQIKKAAKALRDPGTTSSWRSPLGSARSTLAVGAATETTLQPTFRIERNGNPDTHTNTNAKEKEKEKDKEKEKKVFLHNWRSQKSESERSRRRRGGKGEDCLGNGNGNGSSSTPEESIEDSLSDARNGGNDSKSDTYAGDRYASMILKCKDANFMPSIRRNIKKKSKKNNFSTAILRHNSDKLQQQMASSRIPRRVLEGLPGLGLGLGGDDSASLVDQSEDTEDYSNAEDFRRFSAASPLLARLRSKNWAYSSSKFRNSRRRREDSSYTYSTPALSTSSYNRYGVRNPSTVGSWDGTTQSFNDGDDDDEVEDQLDLPGRHGCGISCWSRSSRRSTPKYRAGYGSCYSPSLSDTLRRKGSSIFCGSQTVYQRRRRRSSLDYNKRRHGSRAVAQGLIPLLTNGDDGPGGSSMGTGISDDELSTNFGELDLEALSRLDGRRWSTSCKSQDGLELVAFNGEEEEEEGSPENIRSLCQKYRPTFFEELIGQTIVVQSLMNAISRGRIAPVYLLQGPRGTGKTSTARIFAAALNCLATEETKPCGVCRECADFISGKCKNVREVDGTNKKGIDKVKYLLKSLSVAHQSTSSGYKVFVIDECHLLPSKTWLAFLKFLEEPPPRVVFVFITTDLDNVPRAILSRCQKYLFNKIRDNDIVIRLKKIVDDENLDVEPEALELIALNADGSLRDAETMLDQLSLLGKRITTSLVNDLVGVVSDEKLLELLELAMSSDTAETVKRARELLDSGIDPIVLMSQLATLIMDIIAGTHPSIDAKPTDSSFVGKSLSELEVDRLKHALKLLSDAEKQLRVSSERSTWFTATLLQLGSVPSLDQTHSGSSRRQSSKATEEDPSTSTFREVVSRKQQKGDSLYAPCKLGSPSSFAKGSHRISSSKDLGYAKITQSKLISGESLASQDELKLGKTVPRSLNTNMLDDIWVRCIEKCHSNTLKQLLHTCGTLVSMSEIDSVFVAHIAFRDNEIKTRAERFLSSITNSFENVLRRNVDVRLVLLPEEENSASSTKLIALQDSSPKQMDTSSIINKETTICSNALGEYSGLDAHHEPLHASSGSFNDRDGKLVGGFESTSGNAKINSSKERISEIPVQRIESIIHEQRLETAWLQAMEKGTPGSLNRLKPERNQVLPQDGIYHDNQLESMASLDLSSQHWQDELKDELKNLKMSDEINPKDPNNKMADYPISPSLLHDTSYAVNIGKETMGYESGSGAYGCSGFLCWNHTKPQRRGKIKGTPVRPNRNGRISWFGECAKGRTENNRYRR